MTSPFCLSHSHLSPSRPPSLSPCFPLSSTLILPAYFFLTRSISSVLVFCSHNLAQQYLPFFRQSNLIYREEEDYNSSFQNNTTRAHCSSTVLKCAPNNPVLERALYNQEKKNLSFSTKQNLISLLISLPATCFLFEIGDEEEEEKRKEKRK